MHRRADEQHPFDYDWQTRFPEHERVLGGEGWTVSSARAEDAWWLIFDDGTLAEFMDPVEDGERTATLVRLERFEDPGAWRAAIDRLRSQGRPTRRMVKYLNEDS
jgi:hypothetical protein